MLKAMQKTLGDHHDTHVIMETIGGAIGPDALPAVKKAWAAAKRKAAGVQAKRAAGFLVRAYMWRNRA